MSFSFLRYFDGAKPGEKRKAQVSNQERAEENKNRWKAYESENEDRGFQVSWKKDRPWLYFENEVMT